jgi:hypothetical protein
MRHGAHPRAFGLGFSPRGGSCRIATRRKRAARRSPGSAPSVQGRRHRRLVRLLPAAPQETRRFAWERIEERSVVEGFAQNLDYDRTFPLLALDGRRVVADATLHYREHGPLRLVGRIKWLIDPKYRGVGLGT